MCIRDSAGDAFWDGPGCSRPPGEAAPQTVASRCKMLQTVETADCPRDTSKSSRPWPQSAQRAK
eukprot:1389096-Alexandrium_andersonii.AAC.1